MGELRTVNTVVEEIFTVFENVRSLLANWNSRYHMTFVQEVMRLKRLEVELNTLGYDDDFVTFVLEHVYNTVFRYNPYKDRSMSFHIVPGKSVSFEE